MERRRETFFRSLKGSKALKSEAQECWRLKEASKEREIERSLKRVAKPFKRTSRKEGTLFGTREENFSCIREGFLVPQMLKGRRAKARCFSKERRLAKVDTPRRRATTREDDDVRILAALPQELKTLWSVSKGRKGRKQAIRFLSF